MNVNFPIPQELEPYYDNCAQVTMIPSPITF
jgi:hypothetical protein